MFDHLAEMMDCPHCVRWRAEIERLTNDLRNCCRELLDERERLRRALAAAAENRDVAEDVKRFYGLASGPGGDDGSV